MNAATLQLFRKNLLRQLDSVAPHCLPAAQLLVGVQAGGFPAAVIQDVEAALHYLNGKGLVDLADKVVSPDLKEWQITADGTDYVAANPL